MKIVLNVSGICKMNSNKLIKKQDENQTKITDFFKAVILKNKSTISFANENSNIWTNPLNSDNESLISFRNFK